ncbi:MAG TPA: M14 family metallopeptidase [Terriglobales bacterium]|nr:M14 family metallopeptidase [Terriglobales bacterium]
MFFMRILLAVFLVTAAALAQPEPAADWRTPAEKSAYRTTPRYDETMAYVRRLAAAASGQVRTEVFGRTGEGRELVAVVVSRDGVFDPEALHRAGRPIVLLQNAIHAGEMDGKDACLALLRDILITREKAALIERAVLVVVPIYNADGHERFGPYNRINQNGPEAMGWRTNASNLNLNRDYMKADTPETQAFLDLWNRFLPDFFVDNHVTDGLDHQYDTTYALEAGPNVFPALADWQKNVLAPYLLKSVGASGHKISPYGEFIDPADPAQGMYQGENLPRYSTGYAVLQNRPGLLVEMHMLKDYPARVTGNYEIMRALLEVINRDADLLTTANRDADAATIAVGKTYDPRARFPLRLELTDQAEPFFFRGYHIRRTASEISGAPRVEYTREPMELEIPYRSTFRVRLAVVPPVAYIIPPQWKDVIRVLEAHGLRLKQTTEPWTDEVETYRCQNPKWRKEPFEGRQVLFRPGIADQPGSGDQPWVTCRAVHEELTFPAGSAVVLLDQRAAKVAIHFLEPQAPDSAVAWGFFNAIFEQKEYAEDYVMEKMARDMLEKDAKLREEFERRLASDKAFAASPSARLDFFFQRSPYRDQRLGLYPVGRLTSLEGVPLAR